jgi:hypothetical protein
MSRTNIIGLVGFISSGKNTVANILNDHQYTSIAFADSVKDMLSVMFDWPRELLEGDTELSREWRTKTDDWWTARLDIPDFSPRWAMQRIGTNVFREHFHEDIWIIKLEKKLATMSGNIVVTDCRFPNEIAAVRRMGGTIVRVRAGRDHAWFSTATEHNNANDSDHQQMLKNIMDWHNVHTSEYAWIGQPIDYTIHNDGTIDALQYEVERLIEQLGSRLNIK